jgi:hypothetical protein
VGHFVGHFCVEGFGATASWVMVVCHFVVHFCVGGVWGPAAMDYGSVSLCGSLLC